MNHNKIECPSCCKPIPVDEDARDEPQITSFAVCGSCGEVSLWNEDERTLELASQEVLDAILVQNPEVADEIDAIKNKSLTVNIDDVKGEAFSIITDRLELNKKKKAKQKALLNFMSGLMIEQNLTSLTIQSKNQKNQAHIVINEARGNEALDDISWDKLSEFERKFQSFIQIKPNEDNGLAISIALGLTFSLLAEDGERVAIDYLVGGKIISAHFTDKSYTIHNQPTLVQ